MRYICFLCMCALKVIYLKVYRFILLWRLTGIVIKKEDTGLGVWCCLEHLSSLYQSAWARMLALLLPSFWLVCTLGHMAPIVGSWQPMRERWIELLTPSFSPTQPWMWRASGEWGSRADDLDCSCLHFSAFQVSRDTFFKCLKIILWGLVIYVIIKIEKYVFISKNNY